MAQKILVCEDSQTMRKAVEITLAQEGFELHFASTEAQVLPAALEFQPDLILLDNRLNRNGENDGLEVCKQLKDHAALRRIPVVFLAGRSHDNELGKEIGALGSIAKPFKTDAFRSQLQDFLTMTTEEAEVLEEDIEELDIIEEVEELDELDELDEGPESAEFAPPPIPGAPLRAPDVEELELDVESHENLPAVEAPPPPPSIVAPPPFAPPRTEGAVLSPPPVPPPSPAVVEEEPKVVEPVAFAPPPPPPFAPPPPPFAMSKPAPVEEPEPEIEAVEEVEVVEEVIEVVEEETVPVEKKATQVIPPPAPFFTPPPPALRSEESPESLEPAASPLPSSTPSAASEAPTAEIPITSAAAAVEDVEEELEVIEDVEEIEDVEVIEDVEEPVEVAAPATDDPAVFEDEDEEVDEEPVLLTTPATPDPDAFDDEEPTVALDRAEVEAGPEGELPETVAIVEDIELSETTEAVEEAAEDVVEEVVEVAAPVEEVVEEEVEEEIAVVEEVEEVPTPSQTLASAKEDAPAWIAVLTETPSFALSSDDNYLVSALKGGREGGFGALNATQDSRDAALQLLTRHLEGDLLRLVIQESAPDSLQPILKSLLLDS